MLTVVVPDAPKNAVPVGTVLVSQFVPVLKASVVPCQVASAAAAGGTVASRSVVSAGEASSRRRVVEEGIPVSGGERVDARRLARRTGCVHATGGAAVRRRS